MSCFVHLHIQLAANNFIDWCMHRFLWNILINRNSFRLKLFVTRKNNFTLSMDAYMSWKRIHSKFKVIYSDWKREYLMKATNTKKLPSHVASKTNHSNAQKDWKYKYIVINLNEKKLTMFTFCGATFVCITMSSTCTNSIVSKFIF